MDISSNSTPSSEDSYLRSSTPTVNNSSNLNSNNNTTNSIINEINANAVSNSYSANALPRILSSSSTPTSHGVAGVSGSASASTSAGHHHLHHQNAASSSASASSRFTSNATAPTNSSNSNPNQLFDKWSGAGNGGILGTATASPSSSSYPHHTRQPTPQMDSNLNSNTPGPPFNGGTHNNNNSIAVLPKILSHTSATKQLDHADQKALLMSRSLSTSSSVSTPGVLDGTTTNSTIRNLMNHYITTVGQSSAIVSHSLTSSSLAQHSRSDSCSSIVPISNQSSTDGPPTPTQEKDLMDMMDKNNMDLINHRKGEYRLWKTVI